MKKDSSQNYSCHYCAYYAPVDRKLQREVQPVLSAFQGVTDLVPGHEMDEIELTFCFHILGGAFREFGYNVPHRRCQETKCREKNQQEYRKDRYVQSQWPHSRLSFCWEAAPIPRPMSPPSTAPGPPPSSAPITAPIAAPPIGAAAEGVGRIPCLMSLAPRQSMLRSELQCGQLTVEGGIAVKCRRQKGHWKL